MRRARNRLSASSGFPLPSLMIFASVTIADFALTVSVAYPQEMASSGLSVMANENPMIFFYNYIINQFVEN